jgi:hypothetical protein
MSSPTWSDLKLAGQNVTPGDPLEKLRARWVMWTLTSTVRPLRDHATRALYCLGCRDPIALFELALDSLTVNDPYVPERMLAASYGVAMSLWLDPRGEVVRSELPGLASALVDRLFAPGAGHLACHALIRDSAIGIITLAQRTNPDCISGEKRLYLKPPFDHVSSPFSRADEIRDADTQEAEHAIHMDFGNYTIGRLIPERGNYDYEHPTYVEVRRQIDGRIMQLGFSSSRFASIDANIARSETRHGRTDRARTDRYGKKYSWIAYFEMYGLREGRGELDDRRADVRVSDVDIDPSFPEPPRVWRPELPDLFSSSPVEIRAWIRDGPTPDYGALLSRGEVDSQAGPWALVDGYVEQTAPKDDRHIFTFLRGVFVNSNHVHELLGAFDARTYPGNSAIPELPEDYYAYAGEIPWSERFAGELRSADGKAQPDRHNAFDHHDGSQWRAGVLIELPARTFCWESYRSTLNQVSGVDVPALALCERLGLVKWKGEWDLRDSTGELATLYREFKSDGDVYRSDLLYIRNDLLAEYLAITEQSLVWLVWGERGVHRRLGIKPREQLRDLFADWAHIHRQGILWRK